MDSANYKRMTPEQRLTAVSIDISKHPEFSQLSGVACLGKVTVTAAIPTACTDGVDEMYNPDFVLEMTRTQLRYLKLHETLHKSLRHCTEYNEICRKYPDLSNQAMDYVVNGMIEEADPDFKFIERPTSIPPLVDEKYKGWSFLRVLKDLLKQQEENPEPQGGGGNGHQSSGTLDQHIQNTASESDINKLNTMIDDALHQGKIVQARIKQKGEGGVGGALDAAMRKRDTNWRQYLRDFLTEICEGDEQSRFCPPNKRMLASGFVMPSHFSESTGEIIVACDTSGSMDGLYPTVFGEIARICENVAPESVRVLWWEYKVVGDQQFKPIDYPNIAKQLKPKGGGGTRLSSVAEYITTKKYKPKAVIILTDGYIESDYMLPEVPVLFGVCDNDHFTGRSGKTVRIYS